MKQNFFFQAHLKKNTYVVYDNYVFIISAIRSIEQMEKVRATGRQFLLSMTRSKKVGEL